MQNQGPPVPPERLEHIFDKFYRVNAADRVTGTGLGLSICKGIVEAHGGRIWAENLPTGLAFNFTLPLTHAGAPVPRLARPEHPFGVRAAASARGARRPMNGLCLYPGAVGP